MAVASALPRDNAFWHFSLKVYGSPGVADECLTLQETLGIDVNLLLFVAWLGAKRHIVITESDIERLETLIGPWHQRAVRPLRAIRRDLKTFGTPDSDIFRQRVKTIEIEAEQLEQAMLFAHSVDRWPTASSDAPADAASRNMELYLRHLAGSKAISSFAALIAASLTH